MDEDDAIRTLLGILVAPIDLAGAEIEAIHIQVD